MVKLEMKAERVKMELCKLEKDVGESKGSDLKVFGRITMGENGNKVKDTF